MEKEGWGLHPLNSQACTQRSAQKENLPRPSRKLEDWCSQQRRCDATVHGCSWALSRAKEGSAGSPGLRGTGRSFFIQQQVNLMPVPCFLQAQAHPHPAEAAAQQQEAQTPSRVQEPWLKQGKSCLSAFGLTSGAQRAQRSSLDLTGISGTWGSSLEQLLFAPAVCHPSGSSIAAALCTASGEWQQCGMGRSSTVLGDSDHTCRVTSACASPALGSSVYFRILCLSSHWPARRRMRQD